MTSPKIDSGQPALNAAGVFPPYFEPVLELSLPRANAVATPALSYHSQHRAEPCAEFGAAGSKGRRASAELDMLLVRQIYC